MRNICSKFLTLLSAVSVLGLGVSSHAQVVWQVGLDDNGWPAGDGGGPATSFVQENGSINPLPGSPTSTEAPSGADNDYYFSGIYSTVINGTYTPVGVVAANEEAAERAFAAADNDLRYHFNLPATLRPYDLLSVTFDANNLDDPNAVNTDPRYGIEVYFNGVLVQTQIVIRPAQLGTDYTTAQFKLASVNAQVGPGFDNIVSLRGINYNTEGGGNWMGIDYVRLDATNGAGSLPSTINIGGNKVGTVTPGAEDGSYTIMGGGNDIWDQRDEFTYAYTEVTGDFDVQVRVASLGASANWPKAGIMARETLSEYSRMAFARVTSDQPPGVNDVRFAYRTGLDNVAGANGGQHEDGGGNPSGIPNAWLRLARIGNTVSMSNSADGIAWNLVSSQDTTTWGGGALSNKLFVGLGVSRHGSATTPTVTAEFRNFQFNTNAAPFAVVGAESRGNPNGVRVLFNNPVGAGAFNPANYVLTASGGPLVTTVTGVRFTTANDSPNRDPLTYTLEGTTGDPAVGGWELIASGLTGLATDPGRNTVGPAVNFVNAKEYRAYRVLFPTVRDASANSMQIAEIELLDAGGVDVTAPGDAVVGVVAIAGQSASAIAVAGTAGGLNNYPAGEHPGLAIDNGAGTKYLNFAEVNTGIIVTPAGGTQPGNPLVTGAGGGPNANTVQLTVSQLVEGATYEVLVDSGVLASDGTSLASAIALLTHGAGYEARRIHVTHNKTDDHGYYRVSDAVVNGIGDVTMLGGGVFSPIETNSVFEDPIPDTGSNERFSTRIAGVLAPTTTGNHTFYWSSDDNGTLFMSTDANPVNKREIAREPVWSGVRTWIGEAGGGGRLALQSASGGPQANISGALALTAGNRYYLEGIFSEGGGGNNGSAAWLPPGGAAVVNGGSPIPESAFAPSRLLYGNYFNTLGPVRILSQPAAQTVVALLPVTFSVILDGTPRYTYQWRRNGVAIPGATGRSYTLPAAQLSDDQVVFSVEVANEFSSAISGGALLTVLVPTPPHVLSATADTSFTRVTVRFDNRLEVASAQNLANYTLTHAGGPVNIVSATRAANARDVVLITAQMSEDTLHTLTVRAIRDETGTTTLESNPTNTTFTTFAFALGYVQRQQHLAPAGDYGAGSVDQYITDYRAGTAILRGECLADSFEYNLADIGLPGFPGRPDNFGGLIVGYFVPPVSGDYTFYLAADDFARFFLSTDANPANRVLVAREPVWSARRTWTGEASGGGRGTPPANIYTATGLVSGQRYFFEAFFTEGGGGDNLAVDIQGPGDPVPNINDAPRGGANLGTYVQAGALTITNQPQPQNKTVNGFAIFTVGASATSALCGGDTIGYQWRLNGVAIPGANQASYTNGPLTAANNGEVYSVVVTSPARSVTSANALLTVVADNVPPVLVSAGSDSTLLKVILEWSELMSPGPVGELGNYILKTTAGVDLSSTITAVTLDPNGRTVRLDLNALLEPSTTYNVEVDFQADLVGNQPVPVGMPTGDPLHGVVKAFTTWSVVPGYVRFEAYGGGSGTAVSVLTSLPTFPDSPDLTSYITAMDSRIVYPTDAREQFGARMTGYYVPPSTQEYTFYVRSDDASELWLSTDANPANLVKIAEETGCCNAFAAHPSGSIPLVGGQRYYIQLLYREGGGGDFGQVAVKPTSSTQDPNTLTPISGNQIAALFDPTGASVTITENPADQTFSGTSTAFTLDFNANDGGFFVETPQPYNGPWTYSAPTGSWIEDGQGPENSRPNTSILNTPALTVKANGNVVLTFAHRHSFEGGFWDGGQVRISVNGGAYTIVPGSAFTANGYNGMVLPNSASVLKGQEAFVETSAGHGAGTLLTSVANLGAFVAGDVIRLQFIAASDTNTKGTTPCWEIDSMSSPNLDSYPGNTAKTVTFSVVATGQNILGANQPLNYQWFRDDGAGFVAIAGATGQSYSLAAAPSENGTQFRVVVGVVGASATSSAATLTVGTVVTLKITRTGNQITLSWTGALTLQEADAVTGPWVASARANGVPFTPPATGNKFYKLVP